MLNKHHYVTKQLVAFGIGALISFGAATAYAQDLDAFPEIVAAPGTELTNAETDSFASVTLNPIGKIKAKLDRVVEGKVTRLSYGTVGDHPPGELGIYRHLASIVKKIGGHQINSGFNPAASGILVTGDVVFALTAEDRAPLAILGVTNSFNYRLTIIEP